tara:strand:+ start:20052 stop:20198 length:147 start_codon:yes stop_codon:yes gene_type:complete
MISGQTAWMSSSWSWRSRKKFGIAIPDADAEKNQTVGEAITYVEGVKA